MGEVVSYERKNKIALIPKEDIEAVGDEIGRLVAQVKILEKQKKDITESLLYAFNEYDIDKWTTNGGTQITRVVERDKEIEEFDVKTFMLENPELYAKYLVKRTRVGKAPYIKITPPKE